MLALAAVLAVCWVLFIIALLIRESGQKFNYELIGYPPEEAEARRQAGERLLTEEELIALFIDGRWNLRLFAKHVIPREFRDKRKSAPNFEWFAHKVEVY